MAISFPVPTNPKDKEDFIKQMDEICDSLTRIAAERDFIKAEVDALAEKYEVPKKVVNKFYRAYYKMNFRDIKGDTDELIEFYETLTGKSVDPYPGGSDAE